MAKTNLKTIAYNTIREKIVTCEYAPGYFYDRPLPLDEFEKRLELGEYPIN